MDKIPKIKIIYDKHTGKKEKCGTFPFSVLLVAFKNYKIHLFSLKSKLCHDRCFGPVISYIFSRNLIRFAL